MPVQGHPGSKYIGPIENPSVASYLTSFELKSPNLSVIILEIFSRTVQRHPRSKVMLTITCTKFEAEMFWDTFSGGLNFRFPNLFCMGLATAPPVMHAKARAMSE